MLYTARRYCSNFLRFSKMGTIHSADQAYFYEFQFQKISELGRARHHLRGKVFTFKKSHGTYHFLILFYIQYLSFTYENNPSPPKKKILPPKMGKFAFELVKGKTIFCFSSFLAFKLNLSAHFRVTVNKI